MSKTVLFVVTALVAFLLPLCLVIIWKTKTKCNWLTFAIGALCFMLFANVLEAIMHTYVLSINQTTMNFFNSNKIAYALYIALAAGVFEEGGRLFAFKCLLKKETNKETSVGYGIGHGGIECVITLGVTYLLYSIVLLGGSLGDSTSDTMILDLINQIDSSVIPVALFERIIAMSLHIALSVFVFKAAHDKKSFYLFPLSILIHMLVDMPAGLYQTGIISSLLLTEGLTALIVVIVVVFAFKTYKKMESN